MIASKNFKLDQMDVVFAFVNESIHILIFLMQPEGFNLGDSVCCLLKSIYRIC